VVNASTIRLAAGILFATLLIARPAVAQWRVGQATSPGTEERIDVAIVENDSGHSLRLFGDDTQNVRATFTIRGGFDTMDPGVCPTYRVDQRAPVRVTFEEERCRILPKQAEFTLGKTGQGNNRKLHRIMNGDSIVFRYRLGGGNYRETTFTLRGSKYALTTAVEDLEAGVDE
jgi:hypothetical protein